jgi:glucose-6-phosphate 1-dehydrogenase
MALNSVVTRAFREDQIFRIDHYVGKEAVQNVLAFRFANSIFEPVWNHRYVDNIQITAFESLGVESRGGYYDRSGAIRDMVQNHLFQMLALVAMEPPNDLGSSSLHDEKAKVVRSLRFGKSLSSHVVFGQYSGYQGEAGVTKDSRTETFAALRLEVHNWRFKGVPVYLRTGKALHSKHTRVVVEFKSVPPVLFNEAESAKPNRIVFEASPNEGISVEFNVRDRSGKDTIRSVRSEFLQEESPEAYERILSDFLSGDHTLFTRWDMIEESWRLVDELVHCKEDCPILHSYEPGGIGPAAADDLIEADGRSWY